MVNKAGLLCGLILVLLVFICYLFTSVDLGQLQKNLQQWTKTKISYIHDEDANENKGVINKDINLVGPSTHQNRTDNPSENSTVFSQTVSISDQDIEVTPVYFNDSLEMLNGIRVYDWSKPVINNSTCIPLKNIPKTTMICLFDPADDFVFSKSMVETSLWDRQLVQEFRLLLGRRRDLDFVDIGSNLGLYSLIAATLGHGVVCVEPFHQVFPNFHKSVVINKFQKQITLLANAISDTNKFVKMSYKIGDMTSAIAQTADEKDITIKNIASQKIVSAITWKDLANFIPFTKIVLKYDISLMNHNNNLITEADDLFSKLDVQYVFMHWSHYILDASNILIFFSSRSYVPKKNVFGKPLKLNRFHKWTGGIIWEKTKH